MNIKDLGTEKTTPDDSDFIPIQETGGVTRHITRGNLLAGFSPGGGSSEYIQLLHKLSDGTSGGSSSSGWNDRPLNTIQYDDTGAVTLSSNRFVLPSGDYIIDAKATFYRPYEVVLRLYNHTDSTTILSGIPGYVGLIDLSVNSFLSGRFTVGSSKSLAIQYRLNNVQSLGYALGLATNFGIDEIFLAADIYKVG